MLFFHFLDGVLWCTNVFNFDEVQCTFLACGFGVITKKPLPNPRWWKFVPMFSSKSFIWAFIFKLFKIYFELTFACRHSVVPASFVRKDYTFIIELSWYSCKKKKTNPQLTINVNAYFWILNSVTFSYFPLIKHCTVLIIAGLK